MSVRKALQNTTYGVRFGLRHTIYCGCRDFPDGFSEIGDETFDPRPLRVEARAEARDGGPVPGGGGLFRFQAKLGQGGRARHA